MARELKKTWFIADTHFNHINVIRYNNRPFKDVDEMNRVLIKNWNDLVGQNDTIYILGDFAFNDHEYLLKKLNGKKILIKGSHDKDVVKFEKQFIEIVDSKIVKIKNRLFYLNHCCPRVWEKCHYGSIALFGHSHGKLPTWNLSFDVGVDVPENKFSPIEIDEILKRVKKREKEMDEQGRIIAENGKVFYRQDDVDFKSKWGI